jgi:hypothetical protein
MNGFEIIFVIIVSLYLFGKYLMPFLLKLFVKRMQKKMFGQQFDFNNFNNQTQNNVDTEDTTINTTNTKKPTGNSSNIGDYVDYEEIK